MRDMDNAIVPASTTRLRVMREGHSIIRSARIPKPIVLVDTREQEPLPFLENHPNWIGGEHRRSLKTGDYTLEGMEGLLSLERKNLADLLPCTVTYRKRFLAACDRLARFRWKAILVEATLEDIKGGFEPLTRGQFSQSTMVKACGRRVKDWRWTSRSCKSRGTR